jgi:hypothetical protein
VVLFKRGRGAIIQELNGKSGILVYGSTKGLYEGGVYDIKVYKSRKYYGMPEIIDMEIVKQKSLIDVSSLIKKFEPSLMDGDFPNSQVVRDVRGVYRKGTLLSDGREFKIYFRGRGNRPEDGSKLIIKIAQIGYYKGQKELIVWSKKDYSIE